MSTPDTPADKWPAPERFGFTYLMLKDERLVGLASEEHRRAIERAHESLLNSPVDVQGLAEGVGVDYRETNLPIGVYGSLRHDGRRYVISVKDSDSPQRKRFTLAHELAHLFLHAKGREGVLNLEEDVFLRSDITNQRQEWQANALAAHILMPMDKVIQMIADDANPTVGAAARIFDVSVPAMQVRLGLPIN